MSARVPVEPPLERGLIPQVLRLQPLIVPEWPLLGVDGADPWPLDVDRPPGQDDVPCFLCHQLELARATFFMHSKTWHRRDMNL
jgi:hypothetical protein